MKSDSLPPHTCHAYECETHVPPSKLMCKEHWARVPRDIREAVNLSYVDGQCSGKVKPTKEWLRWARAAIQSVKPPCQACSGTGTMHKYCILR